MSQTKRKITIPVSIGYGVTDIMGGGAFTVIGAWLLFFYTTFVGLSPVEAASIVAIARIVDAIVSLFMGSFTDHFYKNYLGKKFGRRRFFLLIGAPLMLVYALLWLDGMTWGFYLAVYLAFEIIAAMVLIPWETLPSEMTKEFNSRTKMSTCRMFFSATGTFLATFIPGLLIGFFGEHNANAYLINGVVFAVLFMVCVFISWKVTWERDLTPEMFIGTAGLLMLALWQALTFRLNKRTHKIFVDEVERLKANGAKSDVQPETREVVEDLTGYSYDMLWREGDASTVINNPELRMSRDI